MGWYPPQHSLISKLSKILKKAFTDPKKIMLYINRKRKMTYQARLNSLWTDQDFILSNISLCTKDFYETNKSVIEIEHQVGRYLNMRTICEEIIANRIEGDVVEFGTWQGLGLILFSHFGMSTEN